MILIKNGRLIDPLSKRDEIVDIAIENEKIKEIGKNLSEKDFETVIDASGCVVSPGLIDIHVHFRDPGFTRKEDIFTGAKSAAKGGFTTVVCMANTKPVVDNPETLKYVLDKGNIVESGSHKDHMMYNGKYAQLVNHQNNLESIYNENLTQKEVAISE